MKQKHIFILFTLLLPYTVTISPATAVSTCIPLTPDDSCSFSFVSYGGPDWESYCAGTTATFIGVGICSSQTGTATGTTSDTIETSATVADNHNCWCKMTSPAVSRWVFVYNNSNYFQCNQSCTSYCMSGLTQDFDFISAIFSNLTD